MKQRVHYILAWTLILFSLTACTAPVAEAQAVYITRTGKKYHRESCQYLRQSKIEISLKEARDRGYGPCSVCSPSTTSKPAGTTGQPVVVEETPSSTNGTGSDKTETKATSSRQCTAITKMGSRCKRTTSSANGRCWQHQ